jgi:hypothetical protein
MQLEMQCEPRLLTCAQQLKLSKLSRTHFILISSARYPYKFLDLGPPNLRISNSFPGYNFPPASPAPILSPLTNTKWYRYTQSQVPLFSTFQLFVKGSCGLRTVPAGIVSSLIRRKLLHPTPREEGFTVAVFCVPVATGRGVKLGTRVL